MKNTKIIDITLRESSSLKDVSLSFKEKLEIARILDRLKVDAIELAPVTASKADQLSNKTIASMVRVPLTAAIDITSDLVEATWESIRGAKRPGLNVLAPISTVQMEYTCGMKGPAMLKAIEKQVKACRFYCDNVEFSAVDATRAELEFLEEAIHTALSAGASRITLCDTAGIMLPEEFVDFFKTLKKHLPELDKAEVFVQISDEMNMAAACAASAVTAGADGIKCTASRVGYPTLTQVGNFIRVKGKALDIAANLRTTELTRGVNQMKKMIKPDPEENSTFNNLAGADLPNVCLDAHDEIGDVINVIHQLGYDLTDEDNAKVYEAFKRVANKKNFVGTRELDAIIATTALQVPSTYRIESYVINSGNIINATANICLEKNGEKLRSVGCGDGPIDASFQAIEQIIGHHYELDDFQIQTVTEGREAMGSALVRLRAGGRLYSGNGISTDIIGASIRAYISALNKIVYEED